MLKVTVFNEYKHEREYENIAKVYPKGIHGCIAEFLQDDVVESGDDAHAAGQCGGKQFRVRTATFDMPEHGLTEEVLQDTDVLIIWTHALQEEFSDEVAKRVQKHVLSGMGLIALHSAHYSKIMRLLMGTSMTLKWRHGDSEKLWCTSPTHPIAAGIPEMIELPEEEMYGEFFDIPKPDDVVFTGWFSGGEVFRSGCTFTRGYGKIFYFQPGHEEYPIYYNPHIQQIIKNAVRFCAPGMPERKCPENEQAVEK